MNKILYVVSTLKRSGPTNQLFNIIKNLDRSVFEPVLITLSPEPKDSRWQDYQSLGIAMHSLILSRLGGLFFAKSKLKKLINDIKPDLIHTQGIRADVLISQLNLNQPHVSTIHNFPQIDYKMTYGKFLSKFMVKNHTRVMHHIDRLIGCSISVENNLKHSFGLTNTIAIQNGVDQDFFYPKPKNECNLRASLGIGVNDIVWISTGHLSELKDPLFLIDAWTLMEEKHPNHHLVFLGSGSLANECEMRVKNLKNVHLLGRVSNVLDFLHSSDFFISASQSEGLPMAAIEAMACGLPLLVSDIEPYKEIFELSDKVGQMYQLGSKKSFFESFSVLIGQDYSESSKAAIKLVDEVLNAKTMSKGYQKIYNDLLEK
ncbi:MAG: glycosyltransferase [Campylobacterales bacterium]|nr:glycosyltransferase [Campylobacterales bacterium]